MSAPDSDDRARGGAFDPPLIGLVLGLSAALPLYLWQSQTHVGIAAFVIVGYTAWLWASTRTELARSEQAWATLARRPENVAWRRVLRMLGDPGFWWTVLFGGAMVAGSVWYAGVRDASTLGLVGAAWCVVAVALGYGTTMRGPTSRCRRCGYQLAAHLVAADGPVVCPECGMRWKPGQLTLADAAPRSATRRARHAA